MPWLLPLPHPAPFLPLALFSMLPVSLFSLSIFRLQEVASVEHQREYDCEVEWAVVQLCVPWSGSGDGHLFCRHVRHLCRSPAFCRRDTDRHDAGPYLYLCLCPLACPNLFLCRRRILTCWAFGYCAWSATETGVKNGEMVLPVYLKYLGRTTCPFGPFRRRSKYKRVVCVRLIFLALVGLRTTDAFLVDDHAKFFKQYPRSVCSSLPASFPLTSVIQVSLISTRCYCRPSSLYDVYTGISSNCTRRIIRTKPAFSYHSSS